MTYFRLLKSRRGDVVKSEEVAARVEVGDVAAAWHPPAGARTFADLTVDEATRLIGRDAIVRTDDANFGRRARVTGIMRDEKVGFLVSVSIYKATRGPDGWVLPYNPRPESQPLIEPSRVELA